LYIKEKAEKDFWKIIEEEKRKRDRKTVLVRSYLIIFYSISRSLYREMKKPLLKLEHWLKQKQQRIQLHKWLNNK
jgi:hypothetical protein